MICCERNALSVRHENDKYSKFLHNQKCRFDDLVARNARNYTSPIRGAKAVDTQGAWSVYATLQSGADQLIARFDTPDPEYNRILAEDLREKLNEKPV
ncbi:MAG: hypothetical protein LIO91_08170 [Bacteroidales bacterium]|nr:hypothetical protein [Bacteroidales bacterium]